MIEKQVISDNGKRIASVLGIRTTEQRIPSKLTKQVYTLLLKFIQRENFDLTREFNHIFIKRHDYRDFTKCFILLNHLWIVPSEHPNSKDIIRLIRESYHLTRREDLKAILNEELINKQWSSFKIVRNVAIQIREVEPIEEYELKLLKNWKTFYDIRISIAKRIRINNQIEYYQVLLEYIIDIIKTKDAEGIEEEISSAIEMLNHLNELPFTDIIQPIYELYTRYFHENLQVRGYLMRTLSSFGDPLIPLLKNQYEHREYEREQVLRLLEQMSGWNNSAAFEAIKLLCELILTDGNNIISLSDHLLKGIKQHITSGIKNDLYNKIHNYMQSFQQELLNTKLNIYMPLINELEDFSWDSVNLEKIIQKLINSAISKEEEYEIRRGKRRAAIILINIIKNPSESLYKKQTALSFLPKLYTFNYPYLADELLGIYRTIPDLQIETICCLGKMKIALSEPNREALYNDYQNGTKDLKNVIELYWPNIFPKAPLPVKS